MTEPDDAARQAAVGSPIFTPDNEPYLGRPALFHFDQVLIVLAAEQRRIGPWTRTHKLTALQHAASGLVPGACSVAFSVRELVRQAYLLSAVILIRPLVERVSTLGLPHRPSGRAHRRAEDDRRVLGGRPPLRASARARSARTDVWSASRPRRPTWRRPQPRRTTTCMCGTVDAAPPNG
jgi:hypothetical protein